MSCRPEDSDFNYFDLFKDQASDYFNFLSDRQVDATAPSIRVYLLDKKTGPTDTLYNEEKNLIYLPYFTIRATYVIPLWSKQLSTNSITEADTENLTLTLNMNKMVNTMRALKQSHKYDFFIENNSIYKLSFEKTDNYFKVWKEYDLIQDIDLSNLTINSLCKYLGNSIDEVKIEFDFKTGTELATTLVDFEKATISENEVINVYSNEIIYSGIEEMIREGDIIITHHNVMYEVVSAFVANLKFYSWPTYVLKCEKRSLSDNITLPDNGLNVIYKDGMKLYNYRNNNTYSY
jgi:hypothetical protein